MSNSRKATAISDTTKSPESAVVMLRATRGSSTNYLAWVEYLIDALGPKFGNLASVLKTNKPYVVPKIKPSDYLGDEENEVGGVEGNDGEAGDGGVELTEANKRELKLRAIAARTAEIKELRREYPKFYNSIWETMSQDSRQMAQAHTDYADAYAKEDPNELLRIVRETHFTNVNGGGAATQTIEDLITKQQELATLKQKPGESVAVFKKRFDDLLKTLKGMGAPEQSEPQLAMSFLLKLDPVRHGSMIVELRNQAARGVEYPNTLKKAYDLASQWYTAVQERSASGDMSSVFVACDRVQLMKPTGGTGNNNKKPPHQERKGSGGGASSSTTDSKSKSSSTAAAKGSEMSGSGDGKKTSGDGSSKGKGSVSGSENRKCFLCKQPGHLIANCPMNPYNQGNETNLLTAVVGEVDACDNDTDDDSNEQVYSEEGYLYYPEQSTSNMMMTCRMHSGSTHPPHPCAVSPVLMFHDNEVLFDCAAGRSVIKCRDLLHDIQPAHVVATIGGVNKDSEGLIVSEEGVFADLGKVGVSSDSVANILSQAELLDKGYKVSYNSVQDQYNVQGTEKNWTFTRKSLPNGRKSPFYSCRILVTTVQDNMRRYTTREVKQAQKAIDFQRALGYPSTKTTLQILSKGVVNCNVTASDVRNAEAIYGPSVAALKGKTKTKSAAIATPVVAPRVTQVQQTMQADIMFIKGMPFVVAVLSPLGLVMCVPVSDRSTSAIAKALKSIISHGRSRDFDIREVRADGEGGIGASADNLRAEGIIVTIAGPGEHAPVVERMIQTIKARVRAFENVLPFVMPRAVLTGCVLSVVRNINLQPNSQSTDGVSPHEQFTGIKLDAKRDLRCACGDYVQARVPVTDNSLQTRTDGCIVLYPTGSTTGSVAMLKLSTMKQVIRDQFVVLPMPDQVIAHLTGLASRQGFTRGGDEPLGAAGTADDDADDDQAGGDALQQLAPLPDMMPIAPPVIANHDMQQIPPLPLDDMAPAAGVIPDDGGLDEQPYSVRSSLRIATKRQQGTYEPQYVFVSNPMQFCNALRYQLQRRVDWHDADFAFTMSVRAALRERTEEAETVIFAELQQMLDKQVWHGVHTKNLTHAQRKAIIRSSMFLKDKYFASGVFEKFKARLVAGGDQQDKLLYEDLSSPTAATTSVFCIAAIAAAERRGVISIDIGGAFLNAKISATGVKVHMRLDKLMASMLIKLDASYIEFMQQDGTIVVELDRALYGCVEAAYLWYKELVSKLKQYGFVENPYDCCIFNMIGKSGSQITIALHVDDLMVTCIDQEELMKFKLYLDSVYPETKMHEGKTLDYLGMTFDFTALGEVKITMQNCVDDILSGCGVTKKRKTPAASTLFDIRGDAPKLTEEDAKYFHTHVAKVLYLAKRVRPECLTAVAFLATRVHACDVDDLAKLRRLLGYILATKERGIVLKVGDHMNVKAYIDAAYGVHTDSGKSHTGCTIVLGNGGPVFARSSKQKIVTKSSTEAELVAVSDSASQAIHVRNFIKAQGYETGPAVIYQDNLSCLALMKRGGPGSERSRHINIRHFWVKERVDDGEICFEHLSTQMMDVNALTKPVQGAQFERERKGLTNW